MKIKKFSFIFLWLFPCSPERHNKNIVELVILCEKITKDTNAKAATDTEKRAANALSRRFQEASDNYKSAMEKPVDSLEDKKAILETHQEYEKRLQFIVAQDNAKAIAAKLEGSGNTALIEKYTKAKQEANEEGKRVPREKTGLQYAVAVLTIAKNYETTLIALSRELEAAAEQKKTLIQQLQQYNILLQRLQVGDKSQAPENSDNIAQPILEALVTDKFEEEAQGANEPEYLTTLPSSEIQTRVQARQIELQEFKRKWLVACDQSMTALQTLRTDIEAEKILVDKCKETSYCTGARPDPQGLLNSIKDPGLSPLKTLIEDLNEQCLSGEHGNSHKKINENFLIFI